MIQQIFRLAPEDFFGPAHTASFFGLIYLSNITQAYITFLILALMAAGFISQCFPAWVTGLSGAMALAGLGILPMGSLFTGFSNPTLILFGSMFAVAVAMDKSGASGMIAKGLLNVAGTTTNPYAVVSGVLLLNTFLGLFLSNTACAVLLAPIGLALAHGIGANPHAVLMTIAVASSCSFLSPVSTPPNILVWESGGYKFMDYVKVGGGLSFVCITVAVLIIPLVWPVFPAAAR